MTEPRIEALEARVAYLEREQDGEKRVTRHILEQTRLNGDDLAALKTRMERVERKVDGIDRKAAGLEGKVDKLENKVGGLESKVGGLELKFDTFVAEFPKIVADVVREVLKEGRA